MLAWLMENWGTLLICAILVVVVAAILVSMKRNKKQGKSSCGCGCQNCPMSGSCGRDA